MPKKAKKNISNIRDNESTFTQINNYDFNIESQMEADNIADLPTIEIDYFDDDIY